MNSWLRLDGTPASSNPGSVLPSHRRILIVDDNESIQNDFRKILAPSRKGEAALEAASAELFGEPSAAESAATFDLDYASQGQEALAKVEQAHREGRPYSMAFMDVRMPPGWDGIETTVRIWEVDPDLQIVICTAYADYSWSDVTARLRYPEKFIILKKPFDTVEVLQLAHAITEKWLLLKSLQDKTWKLRESEEHYRLLANAVPGIVWTAQPDGKVDHINRQPTRSFETIKDWNWQNLVHPEDLPRCLERWALAFHRAKEWEIECRLKCPAPDGPYRWYLTRAIPVQDDRGRVIHWVGICTDIDDRKRDEQTLLKSHNELEQRVVERTRELSQIKSRLESLLHSSPAVIYSVKLGESRHFQFISENVAKVLGYQADQVVGVPAFWQSHLHPEDAALVPALQSGLIEKGQQSIEYRFQHQDGSWRWIRDEAKVICNDQREPVEIIGCLIDVNDQKVAQVALRESERMQKAILDNIPDPAWLKDARGHYLAANEPLARLLGCPVEEILGKDAVQLRPGPANQLAQEDKVVIAFGRPIRSERLIPNAQGQRLWYDAIESPVFNDRGEVTGTAGIARDITQRKEAEAELRLREEMFRTLADNVPDGVSRLDREGRFLYCNRAVERDLHRPAAALLGKSGVELGLPAHQEWADAIRRVLETGQPAGLEFQTGTNGEVRFSKTSLVPEHSSSGQVDYVLALTRDVTQERHEEQDRRAMEAQLRQAQKLEAIGRLAAGIAHEINTPAQYVSDNTAFLKDSFAGIDKVLQSQAELLAAAKAGPISPELIARVETLLTATDLPYLREQVPAAVRESLEGLDRIKTIVRAMKEFSHPSAREKTSADLNRAIESTATVARNEWKYVADLRLNLDPDLPLVPCFVGDFNQAILNLIVNAAHAIADVVKQQPDAKGLITISTRRDGSHAEIGVQDTGTGIPEAVRHHIFEPFYTTKGVGKGTGQGLSVVYGSIVTAHGGSVRFETETGQGTTFILRLPLAAHKAEPGSPAPSAAPVSACPPPQLPTAQPPDPHEKLALR